MANATLTPKSVLKSSGGMRMPIIGLGTWQNVDQSLETSLRAALEAGYRLIDTAELYNNEEIIGKVLADWFTSKRLKREDIFITTKLPPTGNNPKLVKEHLLKQLKALQLKYVDLYLMHCPVGIMPGNKINHKTDNTDNSDLKLDMSTDILAVWKEMEKLVDAGLTKAIGISNFNVDQIQRILKIARIPPANLQIELYVYHQAKEIQELCRSKGITITSYGTLGSPGMPKGLFTGATINPLEDAVVNKIATAHGKTAGQVLLRYVVQLGVAVIPKSSNPARLRQNIQIFDFHLTEEEMEELNNLDMAEEGRRFDMPFFQGHPEFPFPKKA